MLCLLLPVIVLAHKLKAADPNLFSDNTVSSVGNTSTSIGSPNPNNPAEYCSTIPPLEQACSANIPPTVMVPAGVLKREGKGKF